MAGNFDQKLRLPRIHFRVLLHAANMRLPFWRRACWRFFRPEKSDSFGRVWTCELGYQRPARYLLTTEAAYIIPYTYTLHVHTSTTGTLTHHTGSGCQSPDTQEIHCFNRIVFNLCDVCWEHYPGVKWDLPVLFNVNILIQARIKKPS